MRRSSRSAGAADAAGGCGDAEWSRQQRRREVFWGNGMETSMGTLLSSGIPLLLSSLWIVPSVFSGGR